MTATIVTVAVLAYALVFIVKRAKASDETAEQRRIAAMIEKNRAKPIPGFERIDWTRTDRAGAGVWKQTHAAQIECRKNASRTVLRVVGER